MFKTLPKLDQYHGLRLKGPDAIDFAQRLFSRDVRKLSESEGKLCLFLDAEARSLGIFWLVRSGQADLELYIPDFHWERMQEKLELFQFTEDFEKEIIPISASFSKAEKRVQTEFQNYSGRLNGEDFVGAWNGLLFCFSKTAESKVVASQDEWDWERLQAGIPKEPEDFDSNTICLKLGWEELCDESKGCYAGQEIIERVRSRGGQSPERVIVLESDQKLVPGESFSAQGDPVGRLTRSIAKNPSSGSPAYAALGYLKKKAQDQSIFESASGASLRRKPLKNQ